MTNKKDKWIDAVAKLIKLTQEGRITWSSRIPDDSLKRQPSDRIGSVFVTSYKEKKLRLYERNYEYRPVGLLAGLTPPEALGKGFSLSDKTSWETDVVLEFISADEVNLWTFPIIDTLKDLLTSVRYQAAGVKDFLDEILSDDS